MKIHTLIFLLAFIEALFWMNVDCSSIDKDYVQRETKNIKTGASNLQVDEPIPPKESNFIWAEPSLTQKIQENPLVMIGTGLIFLILTIGFQKMFLRKESGNEGKKKRRMANSAVEDSKLDSIVGEYNQLFSETDGDDSERKGQYMKLINHYYDLVTDFYEYGWGESFHFGVRHKGENLPNSLLRHELWLASKLGIKEGDVAADIGCGIGGPMRNIARFSGAKIVGVNNNAYQIKNGTKYNKAKELDHLCSFLHSDFMNIKCDNETFDCAYAIEATCHAPDKVPCFKEVNRILKPGGLFCGYEWCMTDKFDPKNKEHQRIKRDIMIGDGLPDIFPIQNVVDSLEKAGFEVIEYKDLAPVTRANNVPWYQALSGGFSLSGFRASRLGLIVTTTIVVILETVRFLPKGSKNSHDILCTAADGLVDGGKAEIFTPALYFKARKL